MTHYNTISESITHEIIIKKSRFICSVFRIKDEDEGRALISQIKKEHSKANHSCSAMILGENSEIKRSNDDGEPSGTAGIPILSVLEKKELTNTLVVVTRYFGGIKLGTGGLIRAYSSATSETLNKANLVTVKEQNGFRINLTYPQYQLWNQFLEQHSLNESDTEFTDNISTTIYFDPEIKEIISDSLIEYYNGKITFDVIDAQIIEVPISTNRTGLSQ